MESDGCSTATSKAPITLHEEASGEILGAFFILPQYSVPVSSPGPSPQVPTSRGFPFPPVGVICALGFVSVIAVMVVALRPGDQGIPGPIQLLLLGVPVVLGIVSIVLAARRLRGARRVIALILGFLLVVSPVWAILGAVVLSCLVGPLGLMVCD